MSLLTHPTTLSPSLQDEIGRAYVFRQLSTQTLAQTFALPEEVVTNTVRQLGISKLPTLVDDLETTYRLTPSAEALIALPSASEKAVAFFLAHRAKWHRIIDELRTKIWLLLHENGEKWHQPLLTTMLADTHQPLHQPIMNLVHSYCLEVSDTLVKAIVSPISANVRARYLLPPDDLFSYIGQGNVPADHPFVQKGILTARSLRYLVDFYGGYHAPITRINASRSKISERDSEIIECFLQRKMSQDIIAKTFAIQRQRVSQIIHQRGVVREADTRPNDERIESLLIQGMNPEAIAFELGCSTAYVVRYKRHRLKTPAVQQTILQQLEHGVPFEGIAQLLHIQRYQIKEFALEHYAKGLPRGAVTRFVKQMYLGLPAFEAGSHLNIPKILLEDLYESLVHSSEPSKHVIRGIVQARTTAGGKVRGQGVSRPCPRSLIQVSDDFLQSELLSSLASGASVEQTATAFAVSVHQVGTMAFTHYLSTIEPPAIQAFVEQMYHGLKAEECGAHLSVPAHLLEALYAHLIRKTIPCPATLAGVQQALDSRHRSFHGIPTPEMIKIAKKRYPKRVITYLDKHAT